MSSALLNIGSSALAANQAMLQTISNNIANANTTGYSRQSVALATVQGQETGSGYFGKGVNVQTVSRAHDDYLTNEAAQTRAQAGSDSARSSQLQRLEVAFPTGDDGVGQAAGNFLNAFGDVASTPQDGSARQVVLSDAQEVASRYNAASAQLDSIQSGLSDDIRTSIATVNSLATQVASINTAVAEARGTGHDPNDLLDQRDELIRQINDQIQVSTVPADDGSISLFVGGGQSLVLGGTSTQLAAIPDEYDPQKVVVGIVDGQTTHTLSDSLVSGGALEGMLTFQSSDMTQARNLLGQGAAALAGAVNAQQALGLDLGTPAGAGAPIFSVGTARVLPSSHNAVDSDGNALASSVGADGVRVSSVSVTTVNPKELLASDYEMRADPAGTGKYQVTRLSDGLVRTVASGDTIDGFQLNVASPEPGATDRFLLQPTGNAAANMTRVLTEPKGIAAASPFTGTMGSGNTGTADVASLGSVSAPEAPGLTADITFTSATGAYDWQLADKDGNVVDSGSAVWTAGKPIAYNGWELQLSGVPRKGDTINVAPTVSTANDNGNARAMTALGGAQLVGQQTLASGTVLPGLTITDAYADTLSQIGVRVQSAKLAEKLSTAASSSAETARTSQSGVNLDEEAARLIQFQQSYQASAKVLQVAQSIFSTILQIANGSS